MHELSKLKILAIESSAKASSVALLIDDKLVANYFGNAGLTHSVTLLPMCENLLKNTGYKIDDIDIIGFSGGPGSFTGLRIGAAVAKGLSFKRNIPCIGVSSLKAIAQNIILTDKIICVVMDARAGQVYNAIFTTEGGVLNRLCPDRAVSIIDLESELKKLNKSYILVGDGANLCYNTINDKNKSMASENLIHQNAYGVGFLALLKYKQGEYTDEIQYLRKPQAQRQLEGGE